MSGPRLVALPLTARHRQVLSLVAQGWTNRQIAGELGIAVASAVSHVREIQVRLDADSRWHAVELATRRGLL